MWLTILEETEMANWIPKKPESKKNPRVSASESSFSQFSLQ
jgi:hypothetical protein